MQKQKLIIPIILFTLSGILFTTAMPPFFNIPFLGFFALVPAILALRLYQHNTLLMFIFFGLLYASISYCWFIDIFSGILGYFLIVAVAFWHCSLIRYGVKCEKLLPKNFQVFAVPIIYALLEFAQRNTPVIKEWWFIPFPKTQWGFPQSLQLLSITGITGVTFVMILSNNTIAKIIHNIIEGKKQTTLLFFNLTTIISMLGFGFYSVNIANSQNDNEYNIGVISDMANELGGVHHEGLYVEDAKLSEKIFEQNVLLSQHIAADSDFIIWSENEFFNFYDNKMRKKLKNLAQQTKSYLVVDSYKRDKEKLYDTAVLISPDKGVTGFAEKTHLFTGEISAGFVPSSHPPRAIENKNIKVGLGVCYDFHFSDVVSALANDDAQLILMPSDDDMNQNKYFPYYHATDAVFRAIENNVAVASANTNGTSIVVNPSGTITALSPINETSATIGKVYISNNKTVYTKYGDFFAYFLAVLAVLSFGLTWNKQRKHNQSKCTS